MMRYLILISIWALASARPETYQEKEDFQFSRSSTDEGSKSGFYGAQRGNMGGNYERAHNMDSLAQHQMSSLVKQVDGELGPGANTDTGSVYTAGNSRGVFGSGHYDLSNLKGRNFGEGTSYANSQSSGYSHNSRYQGHSMSSGNSRQQYQTSRQNQGYQSAGQSESYLNTDNQRVDNSQYSGLNQKYDNQADKDFKYYGQTSSQGSSTFDQSVVNSQGSSGSNIQSRLVSATPLKVYVRPGTMVTIPVAAQTYDASRLNSMQAENGLSSESELLMNGGRGVNHRPGNNAKHYESSYSYKKEWEKHDTLPISSTANPFPKNSELYDSNANLELQNLNMNQNAYDTNSIQSSNQNQAYLKEYKASTKSSSNKESRYQSGYNAETQNSAVGSHSSDNTIGAQTTNLGNNDNYFANSKPKSYQSSYSYHKSWERQGDPYVIIPGTKDLNALSNQELSKRLTAAPDNYGQQSSHRYGSHYNYGSHGYSQNGNLDCDCDENGHIRVPRSYNPIDYQNEQQSQEQLQLEQQQQNKFENLEDLSQQIQDNWKNFGELGQQIQQKWDHLQAMDQHLQSEYGFGQEPYNKFENIETFDQNPQIHPEKLEDLGQQTENKWYNVEDLGQQSYNKWDNMDNIDQQPQNGPKQLPDLGQQIENKRDGMDIIITPNRPQKLEDLGQQTENKWDNLENVGQQSHNKWNNMENLDQQTQNDPNKISELGTQTENKRDNTEDLGQQNLNKWDNIEDTFNQHSQSQHQKLEDLGQQTENKWDTLEDLEQKNYNKWDNMENLNQQTQNHPTKLADLGQQTDNKWDNMETLNEHSQNHPLKLKELSQQTEENTNNFNISGQQKDYDYANSNNLVALDQETQYQWRNDDNLGQKTQNKLDNVVNLGQQTQDNWLFYNKDAQSEMEKQEQHNKNLINRYNNIQEKHKNLANHTELHQNTFDDSQNSHKIYPNQYQSVDYSNVNENSKTEEQGVTNDNGYKNFWDQFDQENSGLFSDNTKKNTELQPDVEKTTQKDLSIHNIWSKLDKILGEAQVESSNINTSSYEQWSQYNNTNSWRTGQTSNIQNIFDIDTSQKNLYSVQQNTNQFYSVDKTIDSNEKADQDNSKNSSNPSPHPVDVGRGDIESEDEPRETPNIESSNLIEKDQKYLQEDKIIQESTTKQNVPFYNQIINNENVEKKSHEDVFQSYYNKNPFDSTAITSSTEKMGKENNKEFKPQTDNEQQTRYQSIENVDQQYHNLDTQPLLDFDQHTQMLEGKSETQQLEQFGDNFVTEQKDYQQSQNLNTFTGYDIFPQSSNKEQLQLHLESKKEINDHGDQINIDNKNQPITSLGTNQNKHDTIEVPVELVTEKPGFWKSVGNKLNNAKVSVISWFKSS